MQDFLQLQGLSESLAYLLYSLRRGDTILDLLLVTITYFLILMVVRRSQAAILLRGVLLLALLVILVSALLSLPTFTWMLRGALLLALVATPLIFQPELRRGLERLGRTFGFLQIRPTELVHKVVPSLIRASVNLSSRYTGGLIILEGNTGLGDVIGTGIPLNAELSADLLETIFQDKTPLHDGAVVIREDEIVAAACVLPLSDQVLPDGMYQGTRHRAALGISEESDCLAIVISEETGAISVAQHGKLERGLDGAELRDRLYHFYDPLQASANTLKPTSIRDRLRRRSRNGSTLSPRARLMRIVGYLSTLVLAVLLAVSTWLVVASQVNPPLTERIDAIPLRLTNLDPELVVVSDVPDTVSANIQAPQDIAGSLSPQSFRATADMTGLGADVHRVAVEIKPSDDRVRVVERIPSALDLELQPKGTQVISVTVMIPDRDSLPFSYAISGDPEVDPPAVTVTGPAEEVDVLDRAEVTVPLRSARTTVSDEPSVILKDANGKVLLDLTPDPAKVQVTIPIRQGFNTRDAAVHVVITGTVAPGYWISDISVDPDTVTLLGPPSVLEQMGGFVDTIPVDVNGVAGDINRRVPLAPPVGVTALNQSGVSEGSVEVHATVQALLGNLRLSVPIEIVGARPGDSVSTSPASVDVLLAGPLPVLNQVNADQKLVRVIIDVSELSPGSQEISPTLIAPESLQATMVPNIVQLVIERPSATAQPGATTTPEPTPTP